MMTLRQLYDLLRAQISGGSWWPAESRFEVCAGAILTQNTNWGNVEKSLDRLKGAGLMDPEAILEVDLDRLRDMIRPSGYYKVKSDYLKGMADWYLRVGGQAQEMETGDLRASLLEVRGVGPETADSILLYVYGRPVFIYDLYTRRLFKVGGFGDYKTYQQAKKAIDPLVADGHFSTEEMADFHGLIVEAGKKARSYGGWDFAFEALLKGRL